MKACRICEQDKPLTEFTKQKNSKDGLDNRCRPCRAILKKEYYEKNKEQILSKNAEWAKNNRMVTRAIQKRYRDNNPDKCKERWLLRKYKINLAEYNKIFEKQEGKCKGCNRHQLEFEIALAVDHCHETGEIRGLLCADCNLALGKVQDNIETLQNLINYLKETK